MRFGAVHRIRKPFGRDAPNSLIDMAPAPGARHGLGRAGRFGRPAGNALRFFAMFAPNGALRATENPRVVGSIPTLATTPNSMNLMRFPA